ILRPNKTLFKLATSSDLNKLATSGLNLRLPSPVVAPSPSRSRSRSTSLTPTKPSSAPGSTLVITAGSTWNR
ncbi:hypothetical protein A2U01_0099443, partial [Trifolium medium]|nr:hypothetical protein [Trifolium medium]